MGLAASGYFEMTCCSLTLQLRFWELSSVKLCGCDHRPTTCKQQNPNVILGSFLNDFQALTMEHLESRKATINAGEFGCLSFFSFAMTKNYFGAEIVKYAATQGIDASSSKVKAQVGHYIFSGLAVSHLALGFVMVVIFWLLHLWTYCPGLNPAQTLGPRIFHEILPSKSVLGEHKGDSKWWYFLGTSCGTNPCRYHRCYVV